MVALRTLLLATVALATPAHVWAQETPSQPPQAEQPPADEAEEEDADEEEDEESAVEEVTVSASRAGTRASIDSISYSLADDLQATTGSLADALRNIPSVEVDPNGNVSLRGDANVTILIDGRPSALMSGPGRGAAILQTPADQYSRIEVMTNPSAAYRPDGSGGVINLISRPNAAPAGTTYSGSVRANVGTEDRYNLGVSASWARDRLTLTGDIGLRHDRQPFSTIRERERFDTLSGTFVESRSRQTFESPSDSHYVRLATEFRLDEQWQLTGELRSHAFESTGEGSAFFEEEDSTGAIATAYERRGEGGYSGAFSGVTGRVLRQLGEGHDWTTEIRYDTSQFDNAQQGLTIYTLPVASSFYEIIDNRNATDSWNFSSAYNRPMGEDRKLRIGYEAEITSLDLDNRVSSGPDAASAVLDPTRSNRFQADQQVHAAYATYERPFGDLAAQVGLRLEYVLRDIDQITTGVEESNDYFRAYPTMHVEYSLSETQSLRASYSRRVQRPQPEQLNPFVVYIDPDNFSSGNPDLLPQITDSYEFSWMRRAQTGFMQATLYYRDTSDAFTSVAVDLGGGALLTRPENLGASQSVGVEFVANGRLHPTLRYNASINVFQQQIDASNLGYADVEGTTASARVNFNWQPTTDDFVQVGGFYMGESVYAQGRREGRGMVNFGYRRRLSDRLSLQFTVRDVLDSFGSVTYYETPTLRDRTESVFGGRTAFLGLTWTFGNGQNRQPQQFDFQGPQGGPQ